MGGCFYVFMAYLLLAFSYVVISDKKMLGFLFSLQLEQKLNLLLVISNAVYFK